MKNVQKIAIMTGGGDCPGLNPVIRAVVKTAISKYGLEVMGVRHGYHGLYHGGLRDLAHSVEDGAGTSDVFGRLCRLHGRRSEGVPCDYYAENRGEGTSVSAEPS